MNVLSSLTNRIFLASAALTVLCMGIAILLVNVRVTASAEEELRRGLVQSGALLDQQRASTSDLFAVTARLVADLPRLKAAVDTNDPPTVQPVAAEYRRQVGADLFVVTGRSGRTLASVGQAGGAAPLDALPTIRRALEGRASATFSLAPGGVLQVVSVPITAGAAPPEVIGTLSVGFLLDAALAARLRGLTGSEIAFVAAGKVVASTLPRASWEALVPLVGREAITRVSVGGSEYEALLRPLAATSAASLLGEAQGAPPAAELEPGDATRPAAIILRSRTDRLRFLRPIQTALGLTGLIAVLLATGISYGIARTITRPLDAITATMKEITATGDLTRKIAWPARRWDDEDARLLARTFDTLTDSIARFQLQAAERERLSALGRLSTVIAHEVRNPLMIIKAALRPLERADVSPADIHEAAADIDEEVARLNRLVNDVLDFARPIRFDLAPADINRVCEESAAAAQADRAGPPVHLALDPSRPLLVTDEERLRSVLVNILVNARHAVEARAAGPAAAAAEAPHVELTTAATPQGGCTIVVRDQGEGIPPEDLPRVFEPYFTTKRAGTGLGLAISRNIIEGLGGTIGAGSRFGAGTEIRIELPPRTNQHQAGAP